MVAGAGKKAKPSTVQFMLFLRLKCHKPGRNNIYI